MGFTPGWGTKIPHDATEQLSPHGITRESSNTPADGPEERDDKILITTATNPRALTPGIPSGQISNK